MKFTLVTTLVAVLLLAIAAPGTAQLPITFGPQGSCTEHDPQADPEGYAIFVGDDESYLGCSSVPPPNPDDITGLLVPTVSVEATDDAASESGGNPGVFTISLSGGLPGELVVRFALTGATNGTDYTAAPSATQVTIALGDDSATVTITPIADLLVEGTEQVTLTLVPDDAYVIDPAAASDTLSITDAPPSTVTIAAIDSIMTEGSLTDTANLTLTRTIPTTNDLVVNLALLANQTATGGTDYTPSVPATVTIPAGKTQASIVFTSGQDNLAEGLEVFSVQLAAGNYLGTGTAHFHIFDDDLPLVTVVATDASATEAAGNAGTFTLSRTGGGGSALDVTVAFSGSATRGSDYDASGATATTVSFAAGSSTAIVTVTPLQDTVREGTELVNLTITSVAGSYQAGVANRATVSILDDDVPYVTVAANRTSISEGGPTSVRLTLTRTNVTDAALGWSSALTIDVLLSGTSGSANYTVAGVTSGTVTFAANQKQANVTLTAVNDSRTEAEQTIIFSVKVPPASDIRWGLGSPSSQTIALVDNDSAADLDLDGKPDATDNCPSIANADQADADADLIGDACDNDDDNDGLTDAQEASLGTNPRVTDSDGDGIADGQEVTAGTSPTNLFDPEFRASAVKAGTNGNGIQVTWSAPAGSAADRYLIFRMSDPVLIGTVPSQAAGTAYTFTDQNFPGGSHEYYVQAMVPSLTGSAFNSTIAVTSADAKVNLTVCEVYTLDTDKDGLCDADERARGTDPNKADTDGDGMSDFDEVQAGRNPTVAQTTGPGSVKLASEAPFWIGLAIVIALVVLLIVALVQGRKSSASSTQQ